MGNIFSLLHVPLAESQRTCPLCPAVAFTMGSERGGESSLDLALTFCIGQKFVRWAGETKILLDVLQRKIMLKIPIKGVFFISIVYQKTPKQ